MHIFLIKRFITVAQIIWNGVLNMNLQVGGFSGGLSLEELDSDPNDELMTSPGSD